MNYSLIVQCASTSAPITHGTKACGTFFASSTPLSVVFCFMALTSPSIPAPKRRLPPGSNASDRIAALFPRLDWFSAGGGRGRGGSGICQIDLNWTKVSFLCFEPYGTALFSATKEAERYVAVFTETHESSKYLITKCQAERLHSRYAAPAVSHHNHQQFPSITCISRCVKSTTTASSALRCGLMNAATTACATPQFSKEYASRRMVCVINPRH